VTETGFRRWQQDPGHYTRSGTQSREEQDRLMALHDATQHDWFMAFQDRLFGRAVAGVAS